MRLIDADALIKCIPPEEYNSRFAVMNAPTVEPKKWIPCSERLPRYDETSEYLVTDKYGRVRHCCLDPYMPETFVTVEEGMIVDAVAWRPAPEPYCKTESHEREGE